MMLEIVNYETPSSKRLHLVIHAMRNSWESWGRGDSVYDDDGFILGGEDRALALRLIRAGPDHGKFLRQIPVYVVIRAPDYFWREFDTYTVGHIPPGDVTQNSTSQMHVVGKHEFSEDMFCWDDMSGFYKVQLLRVLNALRDEWIDSGGHKGPEATEWRAMKQAIPDSWIYERGISLNYQALRSMYFARRYHRLSEWRRFCAWIEQLPYNDLIVAE